MIIGFAAFDGLKKRIYDYDNDSEHPVVTTVSNISPYIVEANDTVVTKRREPLCKVPEIVFGNMPNDGGHLLLSEGERKELIAKEPAAKKFIRPFLGSE